MENYFEVMKNEITQKISEKKLILDSWAQIKCRQIFEPLWEILLSNK